jgi:mono/diheme cytochrome c family protein
MPMAAVALAVAALSLTGAAALAQAGGGFAPKDEAAEMFPEHPGRAETFAICSACHGFRVVAAQAMTRQQWDDTLALMVARNNMPALPETERQQVLDYLASAFPPRSQPAGGGFKNPFSQP